MNLKTFKGLFWTLSLVGILSLVACSPPESIVDNDVTDLVNDLDNWPEPQPFLKEATGQSATEQVLLDNILYDCTTTPIKLVKTPAEVVTFQPNAALFWPGNLLQGKGVQDGIGSFGSIPVEASKRTPFVVSIDLLTGNNRKNINAPTQSAVSAAVGELIETAENAGLNSGSRAFFNSESSFDSSQIALELELATEYLSNDAKGSLNPDRADNENTVTAYFVEKAFTVNIDFEGKSGAKKFFNESFSDTDFNNLKQQGLITDNNLPTYLSSVTYGRILMFSLTSKVTASIIQELINALNQGIDGTGANALSETQKELLESIQSSIKVVGIGGPSEANSALISSGDLSKYFAVDAPLTSMVPISYELRTVKGDKPAVISRTTNYEQQECTPNTNIKPIFLNTSADATNLEVNLKTNVSDPDGQIAELTVDWGDGNTETIYQGSSGSISVNETHIYTDDASYTISLKARDNQNGVTEQTITASPSFDLTSGLLAEFTSFVRLSDRRLEDTSGRDNHGFMNTSNSTELSEATDRFGFANKAIDFFGSDAGQSSVFEIRSTASNGALAYGDNYSLAIWIEGSRFGYMIGPKEETNVFNSAGLVKPQSAGSVSFEIPLANNGEGFRITDPTSKGSGWAFYVVTIERSGLNATIKLYRDGVLAAEGSLEDASVLPTAGPLIVGARANYNSGGGGLDFQGVLDDIRVYDKILSPGEINALYKAGGWTGN